MLRAIKNKAGKLPPVINRVETNGINPPSVFANFSQRFAVDAQIGCWTRFQAADTNLHPAGLAITEVFIFHFLQRLLDLFDQFALTVTIT